MLTIAPSNLEPAPGQRLTVTWTAPIGDTLTVSLGWRTTGRPAEHAQTVATQTVQTPGAAGETTLTLDLPPAPWTYEGALFGIAWALTLRTADGEELALPVVVGPGGEAALPAGPARG